jgi:hypothetical protein
MTGAAERPSFTAWIEHVFGHEVPFYQPAWYFAPDAPDWIAPADEKIAYLTRLFRDPGPPLEFLADSQISQGLYYLIDNGGGDHLDCLRTRTVPFAARRDCIASFGMLFDKLFAPRCAPVLGHCDEAGAKPLNTICYMWWDTLPAVAAPDDPQCAELNGVALEVMAACLALDNIACQESALHGLGHWREQFPDDVARIIDAYLARPVTRRPEIVGYAKAARSGCVL